MKVKVTSVDPYNERIDVVTSDGRAHGLDLFRHAHLLKTLRAGDIIDAKRVVNNPFLTPNP